MNKEETVKYLESLLTEKGYRKTDVCKPIKTYLNKDNTSTTYIDTLVGEVVVTDVPKWTNKKSRFILNPHNENKHILNERIGSQYYAQDIASLIRYLEYVGQILGHKKLIGG